MRRRLVLAAALALGIFASSAAPAWASDFYYAWRCSVEPKGLARLSVTNYDWGTGQRYHMDLNSYVYPNGGLAYYKANIAINGVWTNGTDDIYRNYANQTSVITVTGAWYVWQNGRYLAEVRCSIKG